MSEFLVPAGYKGIGTVVSAAIAGLDGDYEYLGIAIEGRDPLIVTQASKESFVTTPAIFSNVKANLIYKIIGTITKNNKQHTITSYMPAIEYNMTVRASNFSEEKRGNGSLATQWPQ